MIKRKQVVFLEPYNTVMLYKIARIFQKKGYETVLIRILEQNAADKQFFNRAYDKVIDLDLSYFKITPKNYFNVFCSLIFKTIYLPKIFLRILRLRPYVFFGKAPLSTPVAFFRLVFKKTPFIYFPYDIRSLAHETVESGLKNIPAFEMKTDRFCFENSDGLMIKGSLDSLNYIERMLGSNLKLPEFKLSFDPYCLKEFIVPLNKNKLSKKDGEYHFVYVGGAGKTTKEYFLGQLNSFKELLLQNIHIHFYYCSETSNKKDLKKEWRIKKSFFEDQKDFQNIEYFHLHDSFNPRELIKEISKYDFGTVPYSSLEINGLETGLGTGNKISTYIEAGIPFFYQKGHKYTNSITQKYGLNLNWPENIMDLKKILKKLDYKKLEENILKAREDFLVEKEFPRLEKFVKQVVKEKGLKRIKRVLEEGC